MLTRIKMENVTQIQDWQINISASHLCTAICTHEQIKVPLL